MYSMSKLSLAILIIALLFYLPLSMSDNQFKNFKTSFNKNYSSDEEKMRSDIFYDNLKVANNLQSKNPYAQFGVNVFSDLSPEEFKIRHNSEKFYARIQKRNFVHEQVNGSIDWRNFGAVTSVKDQGQCGSCWAFSAIGNIEGQFYLKDRIPNKSVAISLSEQELVSCDTTDNGCNGGLPDNAFRWIQKLNNGSVPSYQSYPYVSGDGTVPLCQDKHNVNTTSHVCGNLDLPQDETSMASWLIKIGPISIGVDATSWQTYLDGILTDCISQQVDHAVLLVGFNDFNDPPYWIIKNSWGESWGENGYIRIAKGTNQCLIDTYPSTSLVC